ncbi:hypothetical protein JHL21_09730 [Devosia sp. WQ 349]|uniref:xylulokinase n=1 Tax=Devosia sp. WQ 349K1 TaxID=2800329 RepID=UPI0019067090|nr:FGGY-family carbohydrate kinase [Devosia sp. WQ 349K1]MBK1794781.1 hypothetical protein [Devosia sp. WQ 349K1]
MALTLIGIDVGTTATKAILIDASGQQISSFSRPHPMDRSEAGKAEQSPDTWVESVLAALAQFAKVADLSELAGIGLTSQVNSHVFVGKDRKALRPALTWQDTRAAADAAKLDDAVTTEQKTRWFGGPVPIDASHALSRMAYIARTEPAVWNQTWQVLLPKDYIALQLTGALASDPVAAVGLVNEAGAYVSELLDLLPGAEARLPPLFSYEHVVGTVKSDLPGAGAPVCVGAMDAWAGMFGCGVVEHGDAMYQSGTSEVMGIVSNTVVPTPGVILFPPYQGIRMHAAPTQSGGASLTWLSGLLNRPIGELAALAKDVDITAQTPLFLPHLAGERAPIWDAQSRGVFANLSSATTPGDMAISVLEGVAHSARWALEALISSADFAPQTLRIGGGGAQSDVWCQIRADVLGIPLARANGDATAALGAAIIAGVGSQVFASLPAAVRSLVHFDKTFVPNAANSAFYAARHGQFRTLYQQMKALNFA